MANSPHPSGRLLPASRLVNPVPHGVMGRTDQGVDWSNIRGNIVAVGGGVITQIYRGLSGFGTTVIERLSNNRYVYYAGETGAGNPVVHVGQRVAAGQAIAPGLGTGGVEIGYWDPSTGYAVGHSQGYTEGVATPSGAQFRRDISGHGGGGGQVSGLAQLWIDAGGSPALANTMAAIAMAESGGDPQAKNPSGASGLWQILMPANARYVHGNVFDPNVNAKAAVAIEKSQGLGAWTTYTSGAYKQYLNSGGTVQGYGGTRPGGQPAGGSAASSQQQVQTALSNYVKLRDTPRTTPPNTKNPAAWWWASFSGNWGNLGSLPQ